ncbi:hypothetical protein V6N13_112659 [Hibiscus sabdariffa]|uniref:NAC domain-containing protein n=1 Tax=Hibiscus sabdariffa TaxID=183260 RepID=A0ABR2TPM6_9ROSI
MNTVEGFRFHPTDEELIEFLQIRTSDRDSLVQVIDEVPDICLWEPWQLAESSNLQTGDRLWYFIYSPKYKYRNSKRINCTTQEGFWKPTGNARKIIDPETRKLIGTKKTLVYYKGQCNDKNKIKTCWVMHEYELKAEPNSIDADQKTFNLCKLKKRVDVLSTDAGQSGQHNEDYGVRDRSDIVDNHVEERSNQHNIVSEDVVSNLSSNSVNPTDEDMILKETLHLKEMSKECNEPEDNNGVQKLYKAIEKDDKSCSSVLTNADNETITMERSNQHKVVGAAEQFEVPSSFGYLDDNLIPMDLLYDDGLSFDELFGEPESLNSFFDVNEAHLQEKNRQQCLPAENEHCRWPCLGVTESSDSIEKPRKRPRLLHDGHVETTEAQVGNITYQQ